MKLGIIGGGGQIGQAAAYQIALMDMVDEIIVTDERENMAKSHILDLEQAKAEYSDTIVRAGQLEDMNDCGMILNTAGIPSKFGSRDNVVDGNIELVQALGAKIKSWGSNPLIISATNPADVISYKLFEASGLAPERCIGFSRNDTLRFKWAIEQRMGISARKFEAHTIGEHGDFQVPLFSSAKMLDTGAPIEFTEDDKAWILDYVYNWLANYQSLRAPRSSPWASAVNISRIIKLMLTESDEICSCSVVPNGEYGLSGLSIGLPIRLGKNGVREIVKLELTDSEKEGLDKAAEKIKSLIYR